MARFSAKLPVERSPDRLELRSKCHVMRVSGHEQSSKAVDQHTKAELPRAELGHRIEHRHPHPSLMGVHMHTLPVMGGAVAAQPQ